MGRKPSGKVNPGASIKSSQDEKVKKSERDSN